MEFKTVTNPHRLGIGSVSRVMLKVIIALIPGTAVLCALFGWGVVSNLIIAIGTAIISEALILLLRRRAVIHTLMDLSAVVTAWLLAIAIPAGSPIWLVMIGTIFAIVFAKHLYGGLGYNPFNPAMVGYVVLLISFPLNMSLWPALTEDAFSASQWISTWQQVLGNTNVDILTSATVLDYTQTELKQNVPMDVITQNGIFGHLGGTGWEWAAAAFALGGVALILLGVMPWHAPVGLLLSLAVCAQLFYWIDGTTHQNALFHWFSGGTMLGAFFIVTDPVSGCTSNRGRFIFGALVGVLVFVIRSWGGYPDGIAFAVLLANMAAPTIDYYTKPRVFGTGLK